MEHKSAMQPVHDRGGINNHTHGIRERVVGYTGTVSGGASIISSYSLCHQICLGVIALLSLAGITVAGMPLMFLSKYQTLFWGIGIAMLGIMSIFYYFHKGCISGTLLSANAGFLIAGLPFPIVSPYQLLLWEVGGVIVVASIAVWCMGMVRSNKPCCRMS